MKNKKNIIYLCIFIVLCIIVTLVIVNQDKTNVEKSGPTKLPEEEENIEPDENNYTEIIDGVKTNISEKLHEEKSIGNIVVENVILTYEEDRSSMILLVRNKAKDKVGDYDAKIRLKDTKGNIIEELEIYINTIEGESTGTIIAQIVGDITNAYDYEILR